MCRLKTLTLLIFAMAALGLSAQHKQMASYGDVVILGDSNIWLAGDSCNKHQGWVAWFRDLLQPRTMVSYARSGATWSNTPNTVVDSQEYSEILGDNNVIYNQVVRLVENVDADLQPEPTVVMISAGGNDAWFSHKRDASLLDDVDHAFMMDADTLIDTPPCQVLSLAQSIRQSLLSLRLAFPGAQIVMLTPTPMSKVEPQMLATVSDIIVATGRRLNVPTIRLDNQGPIDRDVELREHVNTYDGIHTTELGASRVGQYVYDRFVEIVKPD